MKEKVYGLEVYNRDEYMKIRNELTKFKHTALTTQFDELNGIINVTKFSKRYFGKCHAWFSQKLHNTLVLDKKKFFTEDEIKIITEGYRDLANQLLNYANELENAESYK